MTSTSTSSSSYTGTRDEVDLTSSRTRWDEVGRGQTETTPKILISSRDNYPVPMVRPAELLADRARTSGWRARLTYALAEVPARYHGNGNLARAAYRCETVAVRLFRPGQRARALWESDDGGPWRFTHAWLGLDQLGLRQFTERIMK